MPRRLSVQGESANGFGEYYDQLQILFTSNLPANSAVMVNQQLAYYLNICGAVEYWDKSKSISRPLKPELNAGCVLAWKRQQPFGTVAEQFIDHIKKPDG